MDPKVMARPDTYGERLLYDFSKFLITLSVLALGALLTLSKSAQNGDIKIGNIIMTVVALGLAAVMAFSLANALVDARSRGREPIASLPKLLKAATIVLTLGIGSFLMMWIDSRS